MATIEDTEQYLANVEFMVKDLRIKYESKQNERILSNHTWMSDYIETQIKDKILPLKNYLGLVKQSHVGEFKTATQFDAVISLCGDIQKLLSDVNIVYKMRANYVDLKIKWQYNIPQIEDKIKSLRNRFNIIKSQLGKKTFEYEEDDWK